MRIVSIKAKNIVPIKNFSVDGLSDVVVVAGQNGVGKTRLLNQLLQHLQNPANKQSRISAVFRATSEAELQAWGKDSLDTANLQDAGMLLQTLQKNQHKRKWTSSLINIESNRSVVRMEPLKFSFNILSPDDETENWVTSFNPLHGRFGATKQDIFKLIISQRNAVANRAFQLRDAGKKEMSLEFGDVLLPFRDAAKQLLAPKQFHEARISDQALIFSGPDGEFNFSELSSGEREVITIVFDYILRGPRHCIVVFDEPELHLHPELALKLIRVLRTVGESNQFIFSTHSADLISSSLENTVVFIRHPQGDENQAVVVGQDDSTNQALHLIGQSVGVVSLGKNIVLIEGDQAALDKQTYGAIVKALYPELVLIPSGGRDTIVSFNTIYESVLSKSLWGVNFFMLCDQDAGFDETAEAVSETSKDGRIRFLSRYHLENYFLDENTIVEALAAVLPAGSPYLSIGNVKERLRVLAQQNVSYAASLYVSRHFRLLIGNVSVQPKGIDGCSVDEFIQKFVDSVGAEQARVGNSLSEQAVRIVCKDNFAKISESLSSENWKVIMPCRRILHQFCNDVQLKPGHFKKLYIDKALASGGEVFKEIIEIFGSYAALSKSSPDT